MKSFYNEYITVNYHTSYVYIKEKRSLFTTFCLRSTIVCQRHIRFYSNNQIEEIQEESLFFSLDVNCYISTFQTTNELKQSRKLIITTIHSTKMKVSIRNFFSKCDQIRNFLRIRSHLLKKSPMENFFLCV